MELLRVPPYPLKVVVKDGEFLPGDRLVFTIFNSKNDFLFDIPGRAAEDGTFTVELPDLMRKYDNEYVVKVYSFDPEDTIIRYANVKETFDGYELEYFTGKIHSGESYWAPGTPADERTYDALMQRIAQLEGEAMADAFVHGEVLWEDNLRINRPYLRISDLVPTPDPNSPDYNEQVCKFNEFVTYERMARNLIDSITGGFYYRFGGFDLQGTGTDYLDIGDRVNRLHKVVENNVTTYRARFSLMHPEDWKPYSEMVSEFNPDLTPYEHRDPDAGNRIIASYKKYRLNTDKNAIIPDEPYGVHKRLGRRPHRRPLSGSDSWSSDPRRVPAFPDGANYTVHVSYGWPTVPEDIRDCMRIIVNDMASGAPNYWSKYINRYETKDFKMFFSNSMFDGTGNRYVDNILNNYYGDQLYNNVRAL